MSEVWWVFSSKTLLSYVVEAHRGRANTALGPGHRSGATGDKGWLSLQSGRQAQIKRSTGWIGWQEDVTLCVFHGRMAKNTDSCMHRRVEGEKEVANRQCAICDHCLSCQIALLLASDYLCYRTT